MILYNHFVLSFYSHIMSLLHLFSFLTLGKYQSIIYLYCLVTASTLCYSVSPLAVCWSFQQPCFQILPCVANWMRNVSHSFRHFAHIWFPVGGAIWGGLGNVALQEEACHYGYSLRLKPFFLPVCSFCFALVAKDVSSHLLVPVTMPTACCCASHRGRFYPSGTASPSKLFCKLLSSWRFNTAAER